MTESDPILLGAAAGEVRPLLTKLGAECQVRDDVSRQNNDPLPQLKVQCSDIGSARVRRSVGRYTRLGKELKE